MTMNFRTLDLNLLRVFDAVMTERHVTRAALGLAMTQPAVSNALRRLREAIGEDLFIPGASGMTPTRRARALWPIVRAALASMRTALEPDMFDVRRDEREFAIGMADATAAVLMPSLVEHWSQQQARPSLRVVRLDSRDPRPMLERGEADCAVGFFPEVARELAGDDGHGTARLQALYDCDYVGVMRRGHPLSASGVLDLDSYCAAQHLRVNFAGRPQGYVDEALARLGRKRDVVLTVDHFSTAGSVVCGSDLVTVLPRSFVAATGVAHRLDSRALPFELPRINVVMLWHRRHEDDSAQQWLRGAIAHAAMAGRS
jgi:DNA-binding transcriptional LysR family regulator